MSLRRGSPEGSLVVPRGTGTAPKIELTRKMRHAEKRSKEESAGRNEIALTRS